MGARVRKLGLLSLHQQAADELGVRQPQRGGKEGLGEVLGGSWRGVVAIWVSIGN